MNNFLEGFLLGLCAVGFIVAIILPIVLTVFNPLWLLLYLIEIPIAMGVIGVMLDW